MAKIFKAIFFPHPAIMFVAWTCLSVWEFYHPLADVSERWVGIRGTAFAFFALYNLERWLNGKHE